LSCGGKARSCDVTRLFQEFAGRREAVKQWAPLKGREPMGRVCSTMPEGREGVGEGPEFRAGSHGQATGARPGKKR